MKTVNEWLKEYWWTIPTGLFILAFFALVTYAIGDHMTGKTLIIQGDVVGHRFKPAYTESGVTNELVTDANGNVSSQLRYYSHHYPEQFILTVVGPDGPHTYHVREATYQYYQDGKTIPLGRLIGGYSKRCVSTWIVEP